MTVPFCFALFHLLIIHGTDRSYSFPPEFPAKHSPAEKLQRLRFFTRDVPRFISASGTLVCLELGLYYGAILSWRSAVVIILLTIGGACLILLGLDQSLKSSATIRSFTALDAQMAFEMTLIFL